MEGHGARSSVAAPLAGGEGPECGRFSITPSQVMVHHHPLLRPFLPPERPALTLGCLEATPLLFWGLLLAPHPPPSGLGPSAGLSVSPNTLRKLRGRAHIHTPTQGPALPLSALFPHVRGLTEGRGLGCLPRRQRRGRAPPSVLRKRACRAGQPSSVLRTAAAAVC